MDAVTTAESEVTSALDDASDPKKLSKAQYKELLERLVSDLGIRLEAVNEELGE